LGSCLLNRDAILAIAPWLASHDFSLERHAWIYDAIVACYNRRVPPDTKLVAAELATRERLDAVGGISYLADLVDSVPTSYHVEYYAQLVERTAVLRRMILAGAQIARIGYDPLSLADVDAAIADAQSCLNTATMRATDSGFTPYSDLANEVYETIAAQENGGDAWVLPAVATGFVDLDEVLLNGLHRQDLILLAARPSVGKSALAGCIATQVAARLDKVLIVSLEMAEQSWFARTASALSGVDAARVRACRLRENELETYVSAIGRAADLPIWVNDAPSLTPSALRSSALKWVAQHGRPDLVIVDYLQLMSSQRRSATREQEVADISRALKALARELDCPVLALSQLSRAVEGRTSHVPLLSDLRESGALEQDADVVIFIYREELHDKDTDRKGVAELHVAKHRNGPLGVVPLRFDASTTAFSDLSYRTPDSQPAHLRDDDSHGPIWPTYD
jgi:replicative DNA helicase